MAAELVQLNPGQQVRRIQNSEDIYELFRSNAGQSRKSWEKEASEPCTVSLTPLESTP